MDSKQWCTESLEQVATTLGSASLNYSNAVAVGLMSLAGDRSHDHLRQV